MFLKKIQHKKYNKILLNELERKIDITTDNLNIHILMCLLLQNSTGKLNQWENEIYLSLNKTCWLISKNIFPSEKVLCNIALNKFSDALSDWVTHYIDDINYKENVNITDYDDYLLTGYIIEYYQWLFHVLAKRGFVKYDEVKDKIETLIKDYNNEKINVNIKVDKNDFYKRTQKKFS